MKPNNHSETKWGIYSRKQHDSLASAQSEASWLRTKLNGDNPILVIHPLANNWTSFSNIVCEPYVKKQEIGFSYSEHKFFYVSCNIRTPDNLANLFKVGDIVWVEKRDRLIGKNYYHVGIVLGKDAICHISDPNALISEENMKARITRWSTFLNGRTGELYRYHPIIPFKHYKKIIEQAVKAYWRDYGVDRYDLYNDNCEHFANAIVYGIYYSQQIKDLEEVGGGAWCLTTKIIRDVPQRVYNTIWKALQPSHWENILGNRKFFKVNNGKGCINLRNEINSWDTNGRFDNLTSSQSNRIKDYQQEYEAQIEVPVSTNNCVIM